MKSPAQDAGLVVGKQYRMKADNDDGWPEGTVVTFKADDGSSCPEFYVPDHLDSDGWRYIFVTDVEPLPVADVQAAKPGFSVAVGNGTTTITLGVELTAAQVTAVLAAAEIK